MQYNVARDGTQLGQFSEAEVRSGLFEGRYLNTDLGWTEGMAEWKPLGELFAVVPPSIPMRSAPMASTTTYSTSLSPASSGLAIASMVLGILSLLTCGAMGVGALAAIICGHLAMGKIKASQGGVGGRGMALAGLVMGYLSLVLVILAIVASLALPVFSQVQEKATQAKVLREAQTVVAACETYADSHGGNYPDSQDVLLKEGLLAASELQDPLQATDAVPAFEYLGAGMNQNTPGDAIVLKSTYVANNGKQVVARKNKSVALESLSP